MSKYGVLLVHIFPYLDWIQENADQKNSVFGHFPRSVCNEAPALQIYLDVFVRALDKCAPKKSKYIKANKGNNESIAQDWENWSPKNRFSYYQERNFSVSLICTAKLE